mgnify:FL=1
MISIDLDDGVKERFVMVLIRQVESYLTKVGIDMGIDEKNIYNVTVQNGQAIKGTVEFGSAVAALIQFVGPMLS